MRFHSAKLPKFDESVIVSITGIEEGKIIYVKLLEYDGLEGNIMMHDISRKHNIIKKFLKTNKNKPFPCSVTSTGDTIPILVPISNKSAEKITHHMNRYYCLDKLAQLTDDFIFQNKDIDPNIFYEKFLWVMSSNLNDMDNIIENQFDEFIKDIPKMFALSELDDTIVTELTKQLSPRITCSEISMYGTIDICVTSAHGQLGTIKLIDKLIELVSHCYYRNAPTYGFIIKSENEQECRNSINNIKQVLIDYANSLELCAVIECDYNNIDIRECVIKLTPLKKTHMAIPATID